MLDYLIYKDFRDERVEFYTDLAEMFETQQNFRSFLERQYRTAGRAKQRSLRKALSVMIRRFDDSRNDEDLTLEYLLRGLVPSSDLGSLNAIDQTQDKSKGLRELGANIQRQGQTRSTIFKYLLLPLLLIPLAAVTVGVLSDIVMTIEKSVPDYVYDELFKPLSFNWFIQKAAKLAYDYGAYVLAVLVLLLVVCVLSARYLVGPLRLVIDKWPGFSLYRDLEATQFFSLLSMLLKSGIKLIPALESIANNGSRWQRWQAVRVLTYLEYESTQYLEAFSQGLCSPYVQGRMETLLEMVKQRESRGDQSSSFADVLVSIGSSEVQKTILKIQKSAVKFNSVFVGTVMTFAIVMAIGGTFTIPSDFSLLMQPSKILQLKQTFEAKKASGSLGGK
jgi:hypothetical protein